MAAMTALAIITVIEEIAAAEPAIQSSIGGLVALLKQQYAGAPDPTADEIAAVRAAGATADAEFDADLPKPPGVPLS